MVEHIKFSYLLVLLIYLSSIVWNLLLYKGDEKLRVGILIYNFNNLINLTSMVQKEGYIQTFINSHACGLSEATLLL